MVKEFPIFSAGIKSFSNMNSAASNEATVCPEDFILLAHSSGLARRNSLVIAWDGAEAKRFPTFTVVGNSGSRGMHNPGAIAKEFPTLMEDFSLL